MNKILRVILIDDEEYCRIDLTEALKKMPNIKIIAEASNPQEAVNLIRQHSPDLIFLDLNLQGKSGFQILSEIPETPSVIAVTAFSEHAVEGFSLEIADYILKPVEERRLQKAIVRAREDIEQKALKKAPLLELEINGKSSSIPIQEVYAVKSNQNYVEIHFSRGTGLIRSTFTKLIKRFPPNFILEISRGHALARHQINGWRRDNSGHLLISHKTGTEFMVSKRLQKVVLKYLS